MSDIIDSVHKFTRELDHWKALHPPYPLTTVSVNLEKSYRIDAPTHAQRWSFDNYPGSYVCLTPGDMILLARKNRLMGLRPTKVMKHTGLAVYTWDYIPGRWTADGLSVTKEQIEKLGLSHLPVQKKKYGDFPRF